MIKKFLITSISALLLAGCTVGFGRHGNLVVVPMLPVTVELDADQNYYQDGYYYHRNGTVWVYSSSRLGPWTRLPRSHYPGRVHYRGHERNNRFDPDHRDRQDDR